MRDPCPEAVAEIERLNMELEQLHHRLELLEDEEDKHDLRAHLAGLEAQISSLKRRVPN